jgi:hypothetical protein
MQKVKLKELYDGSGEVLTKQQMKKILGGVSSAPECFNDTCQGGMTGSSCWHTAEWDQFDCSLNQAQAIQKANTQGGNWCTSSCCASCDPPHPPIT